MRFSTDSRPFPVVLLAAAMLALAAPAPAGPRSADPRSSDPYVVREMPVVRHGASAAEAREAALSEAPAAALRLMLARLLPKERAASLPLPPGAAGLALDRIAVMSENAAGTSYSARLTVSFSRERVNRMLALQGIVPVAGAAPPVLVIPVLVEADAPRLWKDAAVWQRALGSHVRADAIAPVRLPENGYGDRAQPVRHVLSADHVTMELFRLRYAAQGVVLAFAEPVAGRDKVLLRLAGADAVGEVDERLEIAGGLDEAATAVLDVLAERWKAGGVRDDGTGGGLVVISGSAVPLSGSETGLAAATSPR